MSVAANHLGTNGQRRLMELHFTSNEVVERTGITPRQLQWWDERGIVVPHRDGRRRLYSLADLAEIAVICELRRKGFSLQRVRKVMRFLQREFGKRLVETVSAGSDYHLLTDGRDIYLETSPAQVIDILKNARQPMLTVCLSDAVRQVHAELGAARARNPKSHDVPKKANLAQPQRVARGTRARRAAV
jgi:DNA-binding transcriptional MerR regulator